MVIGKQRGITTRWIGSWIGRLKDLSSDAEVVYRRSAKPLDFSAIGTTIAGCIYGYSKGFLATSQIS